MEWLPDPGNHRPVREGILRKRVSCTQKMNLVSFYYSSAAHAAAEKGIHVNIVGMGDPKGSPIPIQGSNNYMKDKDGNVVITKLNEQMGQEIAAAGNGMYVRADNTNSALKALQKEIEKMNKTELDSKVYSEYDEQFQIFAWIALFLLIADFMTLDRKNHIFRKVKLFS